jgi:hypothetical protein
MIGCAAFYKFCERTCAFAGLYRALSHLYRARIERCFGGVSDGHLRQDTALKTIFVHTAPVRTFLILVSTADQVDSAIGSRSLLRELC